MAMETLPVSPVACTLLVNGSARLVPLPCAWDCPSSPRLWVEIARRMEADLMPFDRFYHRYHHRTYEEDTSNVFQGRPSGLLVNVGYPNKSTLEGEQNDVGKRGPEDNGHERNGWTAWQMCFFFSTVRFVSLEGLETRPSYSRGHRGAHIIWSMVIPRNAEPVTGTTLRITGPVPADSRQ